MEQLAFEQKLFVAYAWLLSHLLLTIVFTLTSTQVSILETSNQCQQLAPSILTMIMN